MIATDRLLSVKQVAEALAVSERQVYRLTDSGRMPKPLKIGWLNRWDSAAIAAWIDGGCKTVRG